MLKDKDFKKKMCVIGDEGVGKTSLIRRFVVDKFDDKYIATIGTKTSKKNITVRSHDGDVNLKLMIWDILGQKSFYKLQESAYKGASGAFIVLDLTRRETLHTFKNWLSSMYKVTGPIPIVVLANKNDLVDLRKVEKNEIEGLSQKLKLEFFETSALTGENVDQAFLKMAELIYESKKSEPKKPKASKKKRKPSKKSSTKRRKSIK